MEILVSRGPEAGTVVTVERSTAYGWVPVRGAVGVVGAGALLLRDFECPLNVPVTYRATLTGTTVGQFEATATVPSSTAWLHDPLNPRTAVQVRTVSPGGVDALRASLAQADLPQAVDFATPLGADLPVASIGQRQRATSAPVVLDCAEADSVGVRDLIAAAGELVLRGLPSFSPLGESALVVLTGVQVAVVGLNRHRWSATAVQVASSSRGQAVSWLTWQEVMDAWPGASWSTLMAARPGASFLEWMRDPEG